MSMDISKRWYQFGTLTSTTGNELPHDFFAVASTDATAPQDKPMPEFADRTATFPYRDHNGDDAYATTLTTWQLASGEYQFDVYCTEEADATQTAILTLTIGYCPEATPTVPIVLFSKRLHTVYTGATASFRWYIPPNAGVYFVGSAYFAGTATWDIWLSTTKLTRIDRQ